MAVQSAWRSEYEKRLTLPEEAVKRLKPGQHLVFPTIAGEPPALVKALGEAARAGHVRGVRMSGILPGKYISSHLLVPELQDALHWDSFFCGAADRGPVYDGVYDMTPMHFGQAPMVMRRNMSIDAVMTVVSEPDGEGYVTPSLAVDYTKSLVETAPYKVAEVNPEVPRVYGDCRLHVSQFDAIVESEDEIMELANPPVTPEDEVIGRIIAERIPDGATLQIGFGGVPSAVAMSLEHHRHLGIHTEMFVDNTRLLIENGVIDKSRKALHPGKSIYTFCAASRATYAFLHENAAIEAYPVDYTNDPAVIARNNDMFSINATLMIDLTGQACSESIGERQYSGPGGQLDFVRGAVGAENGQAFIATYATAKDGAVSRIVDRLPPGAVVTTPRTDIDCVVTEYGIAELRGRSMRERAQALIAIAHPDFCDELQRQARARGLGPR
ncbi:MAG: acetyl-CoA hydrolase/transferase C-terminal domain-containing protein [Alphaproteobacteria bacterium]